MGKYVKSRENQSGVREGFWRGLKEHGTTKILRKDGKPLIGRNNPLGQSFGAHFFAYPSFVQYLDSRGHREFFLEVSEIRSEVFIPCLAFNQENRFFFLRKHKIDLALFLIPDDMQADLSLSHGLPRPNRLDQVQANDA